MYIVCDRVSNRIKLVEEIKLATTSNTQDTFHDFPQKKFFSDYILQNNYVCNLWTKV